MELNHNQLKEFDELKAVLEYDLGKSYLKCFELCDGVNHGWFDPEFSIYEKDRSIFIQELSVFKNAASYK